MIRLILHVDIPTHDLPEAYRKVRAILDSTDVGWATADEWYRAHREGPEDPEELHETIRAVSFEKPT